MNAAMMYGIPWILMLGSIAVYMMYAAKKKKDIRNGVERKRESYITEGLYLGMTIGLGIGYLAGQVHWGIGIGMLIGQPIGFLIPKKEKNKEEK